MDIKKLAAQMLMSRLGIANDSGAAETALADLFAGGSTFDLGDIVGQFTDAGGDAANIAESWLGDGSNQSITAAQLQDAIGVEQIDAFATKLGIGRSEASAGLTDVLPQLIDKSSRGGYLLDPLGDASALGTLASKFLP